MKINTKPEFVWILWIIAGGESHWIKKIYFEKKDAEKGARRWKNKQIDISENDIEGLYYPLVNALVKRYNSGLYKHSLNMAPAWLEPNYGESAYIEKRKVYG